MPKWFRFTIIRTTLSSVLDGLSTAQEIANRAEQLGFGAIGITDHDLVSGHISFYKAVVEKGIKPLLGIETYQSPESRFIKEGFNDSETGNKKDNFHLILLAQNDEGLKNLWRINTEAHRSGFYRNGRVDWELLEKYNDGLICTSSCVLGLIGQAILKGNRVPQADLKRFLSIFGDRFYLELGT